AAEEARGRTLLAAWSVRGHGANDPRRPRLALHQQQDQHAEAADHQRTGDGSRAVQRVEPTQRDRDHKSDPQHHVEHDRRADTLSGQGEGRVTPPEAGLPEQPVAKGAPPRRPRGGRSSARLSLSHGRAHRGGSSFSPPDNGSPLWALGYSLRRLLQVDLDGPLAVAGSWPGVVHDCETCIDLTSLSPIEGKKT